MPPPSDKQHEEHDFDVQGGALSSGLGSDVSSSLITPSPSPVRNPGGAERTLPPITVDGVVPHVISRKPLEISLGGQTSVVDRLIWAARNKPELGWLRIKRWGSKGRETLIWRDSADRACERILLHNEEPPELPEGRGVHGFNLRRDAQAPAGRAASAKQIRPTKKAQPSRNLLRSPCRQRKAGRPSNNRTEPQN